MSDDELQQWLAFSSTSLPARKQTEIILELIEARQQLAAAKETCRRWERVTDGIDFVSVDVGKHEFSLCLCDEGWQVDSRLTDSSFDDDGAVYKTLPDAIAAIETWEQQKGAGT